MTPKRGDPHTAFWRKRSVANRLLKRPDVSAKSFAELFAAYDRLKSWICTSNVHIDADANSKRQLGKLNLDSLNSKLFGVDARVELLHHLLPWNAIDKRRLSLIHLCEAHNALQHLYWNVTLVWSTLCSAAPILKMHRSTSVTEQH